MASRVVVCNLVPSFSFSRCPYRDNVSLVSDQPLGNDPCARSRFVDRELIETWKDRSIFCRKKWSAPWIDCPPASRGSRITRNVGNIVRFWNRKGGKGMEQVVNRIVYSNWCSGRAFISDFIGYYQQVYKISAKRSKVVVSLVSSKTQNSSFLWETFTGWYRLKQHCSSRLSISWRNHRPFATLLLSWVGWTSDIFYYGTEFMYV